MKTLKEKWIDFLEMGSAILFAITIIFLFTWGIIKLANYKPTPDTRSIQEIKEDEYKKCIKFYSAGRVEWCSNYLK